MKNKITLIVAIFLICTTFVVAQEEVEFTPGITPDSPFYVLDRAFENMQLALTTNKQSRLDLQLRFAEERIGEIEEMAREQNFKAMEIAVRERAEIRTQIEKESVGLSTDALAQVRERLEIHTEAMSEIKNNAETVELKNKIVEEIQNNNNLKARIK